MTLLSGLFILLAITFASIAVAFFRMPQLVDPKMGRVTAILFIVAAVLFVLIGFIGLS